MVKSVDTDPETAGKKREDGPFYKLEKISLRFGENLTHKKIHYRFKTTQNNRSNFCSFKKYS